MSVGIFVWSFTLVHLLLTRRASRQSAANAIQAEMLARVARRYAIKAEAFARSSIPRSSIPRPYTGTDGTPVCLTSGVTGKCSPTCFCRTSGI